MTCNASLRAAFLALSALTLLLSACASNPTRPYCAGPLVPINAPAK